MRLLVMIFCLLPVLPFASAPAQEARGARELLAGGRSLEWRRCAEAGEIEAARETAALARAAGPPCSWRRSLANTPTGRRAAANYLKDFYLVIKARHPPSC